MESRTYREQETIVLRDGLSSIPASERARVMAVVPGPARARPLPARSLVRVPRQARAVATVHAILDAATSVVGEDGAHFTVDRVAEVARIQSGSLYHYFGKREMILTGVLERAALELQELLRRILEAQRPPVSSERRRVGLEALASALEPYAPVLSAFQYETTPLVRERMREFETRVRECLQGLATEEQSQGRGPEDPARFVAFEGISLAVLRWVAERPPFVSRASLVDTLEALHRGMTLAAS